MAAVALPPPRRGCRVCLEFSARPRLSAAWALGRSSPTSHHQQGEQQQEEQGGLAKTRQRSSLEVPSDSDSWLMGDFERPERDQQDASPSGSSQQLPLSRRRLEAKHRLQQRRPGTATHDLQRQSQRPRDSPGPSSPSSPGVDVQALAAALLERLMESGPPESVRDQLPESLSQALVALLPPPASLFLHIPGIGSAAEETTRLQVRDTILLLEELGRQGGAEVCLAVLDAMESSNEGYATRHPKVLLDVLLTAERRGHEGVAMELMARLGGEGSAPTCQHFNAAIGACAKAGARDSALGLYTQMLASRVRPDTTTCTHLITAHQRVGDWQGALQVWQDMRDKGLPGDSCTYAALMSALEHGGQWEEGLQVLHRLRADGYTASPFVYSVLVRMCLAADELQQATQAVLGMPAVGVPITPDLGYQLLDYCHKTRQHGRALEIFQNIREVGGVQPDRQRTRRVKRPPMKPDVCYTKLLVMSQEARDVEGCMKVYKWMKADVGSVPVAIYSRLVACLSRARQWRRCLELVRQLRADGLEAPTVVYGDLVPCLAEAGKWQAALSELEILHATIPATTDVFYVYHSVISAAASSGYLHHALEVPAMMKAHGCTPTVVTFNTLLSACATNSAADRAMDIFHSMKDASVRPDVVSYSSLIMCCANACEWARAERVWAWLEADPSVQPDTVAYNTILAALGRSGQADKALSLFERMQTSRVVSNTTTYDALIGLYQSEGSWQKLQTAFQLKEWMEENGEDPSAITYSRLIERCTSGGRWEEALELFEDMRVAQVKPDDITWLTLISACAKAGELGKAVELKERMARMGARQSARTFNAVISAAARVGDLEAGLELLEEMQVLGITPTVVTYSSLISACGKTSGGWEVAVELFAEMQSEGISPNLITFNALLDACAKSAQWKSALQVVRYMSSSTDVIPNEVSYSCVVEAMARAKHWTRAASLCQEAAESVGGIFSKCFSEGSTIDLHGLSHLCAEAAVRGWLQHHKRMLSVSQSDVDAAPANYVIITGRGLNSGEDGPRVKPAVLALLSNGMGEPLRCTVPSGNEGVVVVDRLDLQEWLGTPT